MESGWGLIASAGFEQLALWRRGPGSVVTEQLAWLGMRRVAMWLEARALGKQTVSQAWSR